MRHLSFEGVFPILQTPFNEKGEIAFDEVENEVEWLIEKGVDGIGIAIASEIFKLNDIEKFQLLKTVVEKSSGKIPIIMNSGQESTEYTIYISKKSEELGAKGLMIKPPVFDNAPQKYIEEHFLNVAKSVNIPIFLQDQGNSPISGESAVRISDGHENISYIKLESIPTIPRFDYCNINSSRKKLILFGGVGGSFFIEELRRGSSGTMPSSVIPDMFVKVWKLWNENKKEEAHKHYSEFSELIKILNQGLGLASWINKYVLYKRGVFTKASSFSRGPGLIPSKEHLKEIDRLIEKNNLI
jgi:4-hydroxy-tetrahydrodipicolinate synthase